MSKKGKLQIHIIDSVKGGSGKSCFSARLCCSLINKKRKACIIDLDLLGTSWFHLCGKTIRQTPGNKIIYLNDIVNDFEYYKNTRFIQTVVIGFEGKWLDVPVILANQTEPAKAQYKITDKANTTDISYSFFTHIVFKLIKELEKSFDDIILDMPPNSDPYANNVLIECLKSNFKVQTSLYMVSNLNTAHIKSTFNWYENLIFNASSQHLTTLNNFQEFTGHKYLFSNMKEYEDLTEEEKKSRKEKCNNWLNQTKTKFFVVFNDIIDRNPKLSKMDQKALVDLGGDEIKRQLAYYFIIYDIDFFKSTDAIYSKELKTINFGNTFECDSFKLYYEL